MHVCVEQNRLSPAWLVEPGPSTDAVGAGAAPEIVRVTVERAVVVTVTVTACACRITVRVRVPLRARLTARVIV
jgi:hypothetical protein